MTDLMIVAPPTPASETAVLSCCLLDHHSRAYVLEHVEDVDLLNRDARKILKAIRQLDARGASVTPAEIQREIEAAGATVNLGYLTEIELDLADPWRAAEYVRALKSSRIKRELVEGWQEVALRVKHGEGDPVASARATLARVEAIEKDPVSLTLRGQMQAALDDLRKRPAGGVAGISTGLHRLDKVTLGLQPGQLILVAGRPGMGKSILAQHFAREAAFRQQRSVAFISLEMAPREVVLRILSAESGIEHDRIRGNYLNAAERDALDATADRLGGWDLQIEDAIGWKLSELDRRVRALHRRYGIDLVIVDYLGLIGTDRQHTSDNSRVAEISLALKGLARALSVPVVAIAQLSRQCEQRTNKRPVLSDLRDSGALEQDSDVVLFLYRESYYDPGLYNDPSMEIIVAKQRAGETGSVPCRFLPKQMRFEAAI